MSRIGRLTGIIPVLLAAVSCVVSNNDYSEFRELPKEGWAYADSMLFYPTVADSLVEGVLTVTVCHTNSYPYRNLWLEVSGRDARGALFRDTVNMELSDRYGRWRGHGFGAEYQYADTLRNVRGIMRDSAIVVRHIMRVDNLSDIEQLGVTFVSKKE